MSTGQLEKSGTKPTRTGHSAIPLIIALILVLAFLLQSCGGTKTNSNDGKCDICGKPATRSIKGEEYCAKDYTDALRWYVDKTNESYANKRK